MTDLKRRQQTSHAEPADTDALLCPNCSAPLVGRPSYERFRVCDDCGHHLPISIHRRIASLLDDGQFEELDRELVSTDPLAFEDAPPYRERLPVLMKERGRGDAAVYGRGSIYGYGVILFALDFGFLGGSMGVVVGEKLARAAELAHREQRALITVVASGGARMQEGLFSLLQMAKTSAAVDDLRSAGLPFLSILTHPTTGGVFASFASLGDVVIGEPKALIGFAGPRVAEQVLGRPLPKGSHTAEFLKEHGFLDSVVSRIHHRSFCGLVLTVLRTRLRHQPRKLPQPGPLEQRIPWETVQAARDPIRPTSLVYLQECFDTWMELHGDRAGADDRTVIAGLAVIEGISVGVIALERGSPVDPIDRREGRPMPGGYRKAQRLLALADRFNLPVVTLVDTPGAFPGIESEEQGLAFEIASTLAAMTRFRPPSVAVIVGEGGSGGALALAVADRVLMQEHAIYSVISPEGAATILYRDASRAPELAERLRITATEVRASGLADAVIAEPEGTARADPTGAARLLREQLVAHLTELCETDSTRRWQRRRAKYRAVGSRYVVPYLG